MKKVAGILMAAMVLLVGTVVLIAQNAGQRRMEVRPDRVAQEGFAVLGREDQMDINLGERLRHDRPVSPAPFQGAKGG